MDFVMISIHHFLFIPQKIFTYHMKTKNCTGSWQWRRSDRTRKKSLDSSTRSHKCSLISHTLVCFSCNAVTFPLVTSKLMMIKSASVPVVWLCFFDIFTFLPNWEGRRDQGRLGLWAVKRGWGIGAKVSGIREGEKGTALVHVISQY